MTPGRFVPRIAHTVRFRLTVLYSTLLFMLAGLVVAGIYLAVSVKAGDTPVTKTFTAVEGVYGADGVFRPLRQWEVANVEDIERAVNVQTLQTLRSYSVWTLGGLFFASLLIGWVLSGRVLRPAQRIASAADGIRANDLSRRIALSGPDDEFHHLADRLDTMLARLDDAFSAQRRLLDDASHELRNPLAIIQSNTDAVLLADDTSEAERRDAALVINRATRRMTRLVEDLLAAARRDAPAFTDANIDLADLLRGSGGECRSLLEQRRLRLVYRLPADASTGSRLVVLGDQDALRRALANLLVNAARYAPTASSITLGAGRVGDWCWMAVADGGPGIPREKQGQVFDRFWRGNEALGGADAVDRGGHAGLGLAIVRQIVEGHRGTVAVHSELGHGATFVMWVPAAGAATDEESAPAGNPLARTTGP